MLSFMVASAFPLLPAQFRSMHPTQTSQAETHQNEPPLSSEASIRMWVLYCGEYDPPRLRPMFSTSHNHRDRAVSTHLHPPVMMMNHPYHSVSTSTSSHS